MYLGYVNKEFCEELIAFCPSIRRGLHRIRKKIIEGDTDKQRAM
jgi:hypothetical protein